VKDVIIRKFYYWIQLILWVFICLSWSPGLLGQNEILIVFALSGFWSIINRSWIHFTVDSGRRFLFLMIFPLYFFFREGFTGDPQRAIQFLVLSFACYYVMVSGFQKYKPDHIVIAFNCLLIIVVSSSVITYFAYGVSFAQKSPLLEFPIRNYDANCRVYFPFTVIYQQEYSIGGNAGIARCIGIFREPGIYQAVLNTGIVSLAFVRNKTFRVLSVIILIAGVFSTMSTAGLAGLIISLVVYSLIRNAKLSLIALPLAMIAAYFFGLFDLIMNAESVGISSKLSDASGADRVTAIQQFILYWGDAGFWGITNEVGLSHITSLTGTLPLFYLKLGIVGIITSLLQIFAYWKGSHVSRYFLISIPIFISAITSQPLWASNISSFFYCLGWLLAYCNGSNQQRESNFNLDDKITLTGKGR